MDATITLYLLAIYIHILATVLWVGYSLFWTVLIGPLGRTVAPQQADHLLGLLRRALWPPMAIPVAYRLTLPGFGWVTLAILGLTGTLIALIGGIALPQYRRLFAIKLGLVFVLVLCHYWIAQRPTPKRIYLTMIVTLCVVGTSALLVR